MKNYGANIILLNLVYSLLLLLPYFLNLNLLMHSFIMIL